MANSIKLLSLRFQYFMDFNYGKHVINLFPTDYIYIFQIFNKVKLITLIFQVYIKYPCVAPNSIINCVCFQCHLAVSGLQNQYTSFPGDTTSRDQLPVFCFSLILFFFFFPAELDTPYISQILFEIQPMKIPFTFTACFISLFEVGEYFQTIFSSIFFWGGGKSPCLFLM